MNSIQNEEMQVVNQGELYNFGIHVSISFAFYVFKH